MREKTPYQIALYMADLFSKSAKATATYDFRNPPPSYSGRIINVKRILAAKLNVDEINM